MWLLTADALQKDRHHGRRWPIAFDQISRRAPEAHYAPAARSASRACPAHRQPVSGTGGERRTACEDNTGQHRVRTGPTGRQPDTDEDRQAVQQVYRQSRCPALWPSEALCTPCVFQPSFTKGAHDCSRRSICPLNQFDRGNESGGSNGCVRLMSDANDGAWPGVASLDCALCARKRFPINGKHLTLRCPTFSRAAEKPCKRRLASSVLSSNVFVQVV